MTGSHDRGSLGATRFDREVTGGEAGESSYILLPFSDLSAPHNESLALGELHRLASALLCS
jgi:hypothetical protein